MVSPNLPPRLNCNRQQLSFALESSNLLVLSSESRVPAFSTELFSCALHTSSIKESAQFVFIRIKSSLVLFSAFILQTKVYKLMLANTRFRTCTKQKQFANLYANCFCHVHTYQLEFANTSLQTSDYRVNAPLTPMHSQRVCLCSNIIKTIRVLTLAQYPLTDIHSLAKGLYSSPLSLYPAWLYGHQIVVCIVSFRF